MIYFKDCPRCKGDMYLAEDIFGKYLNCLQCGYLRDVKEVRPVDYASVEHAGDSAPLVVEERELQAA